MSDEILGYWNNDLLLEVQSRGYESLTSYLMSFPSKSYIELANELDGVPIKIVELQYEEAKKEGHLEHAVKDSFVRFLVQSLKVPSETREQLQSRLAGAFADWITGMVVSGDCPEFRSLAIKMGQNALDAEVPLDWCPTSVEDPIISTWFEQYWR